MLKISLDEGFIFDILSILNVKIGQTNGFIRSQLIQNFEDLSLEIKDQIGISKFNKIIISDEYKELYEINKLVFESVDLAKQDKILASEVDKRNYARYIKKTELQKKFFNEEIREVKI